ncbi:MAG: murein L,D-transpeptidase, partial [Mesorhizobium sp.]
LMRKDPNYLKDSHIRLFAPDGSEVDPMTVDWSTDDAAKYRFRQDPGAGNAMASVKINFPSPDGVYMHDTPQKSFFGRDMRALSHGCIRLQDPRGMAAAVLGTSVDDIAEKLKHGHST